VILPEEQVPAEEESVKYTPEERLQFEINDLTQRIAELEEIQKDLDVTHPETIVLNNLPKITPVSAAKETGAKVGTKLDISPSLLSGNGVTVEQAAHNIWEDNFRDTGIETEDVRNIIIDILSSGSKANYAAELTTSNEVSDLKQQLRDLKDELSSIEKGKPKVKTVKPIPGQLDLFAQEEDDNSWKDEDNNDSCVPF
jgi:prefoldin subunit 5